MHVYSRLVARSAKSIRLPGVRPSPVTRDPRSHVVGKRFSSSKGGSSGAGGFTDPYVIGLGALTLINIIYFKSTAPEPAVYGADRFEMAKREASIAALPIDEEKMAELIPDWSETIFAKKEDDPVEEEDAAAEAEPAEEPAAPEEESAPTAVDEPEPAAEEPAKEPEPAAEEPAAEEPAAEEPAAEEDSSEVPEATPTTNEEPAPVLKGEEDAPAEDVPSLMTKEE